MKIIIINDDTGEWVNGDHIVGISSDEAQGGSWVTTTGRQVTQYGSQVSLRVRSPLTPREILRRAHELT